MRRRAHELDWHTLARRGMSSHTAAQARTQRQHASGDKIMRVLNQRQESHRIRHGLTHTCTHTSPQEHKGQYKKRSALAAAVERERHPTQARTLSSTANESQCTARSVTEILNSNKKLFKILRTMTVRPCCFQQPARARNSCMSGDAHSHTRRLYTLQSHRAGYSHLGVRKNKTDTEVWINE